MQCCRCKEEKPSSLFYKDASRSSGKRPECKECNKKGVNKERRAEYEKEYWDKRREDRRKIILKSHNKNADHHKKQRKAYLSTPEGISMYRRQTQTRYARKKSVFVEEVDPLILYSEQNGRCYICNGKFSFIETECDHVIPVSNGGKHMKANCKMACVSCNRSKGAKPLKEVRHPMV